MMQDYLHSEAMISERIAMGGRAGSSQATCKEIIDTSKRGAVEAVKNFDNKWKRGASY